MSSLKTIALQILLVIGVIVISGSLYFYAVKPIEMFHTLYTNYQISTEIEGLRNTLKADRIIVFEFFTTEQAQHFAFARAISEVTSPDVLKESAKRQKVLRTLQSSWYTQMNDGNCVLIDKEQESMYTVYLQETGVKSAIKCPIRSLTHEFIGTISVEYTKTSVDAATLKSFESKINTTAEKLGAMLSE